MGYTSLRRGLLAPINNIDQYVTAIPDLAAWSGEPVHWMPLKKLSSDVHIVPGDADQDELQAHLSTIHYQDALKPMMRYVNSAPMRQRYEWLTANPFDWSNVRFQMPYLDVVIVESTAHPGSAYGLTTLLRRLHEINPNIGIIIIDQDLTGSAALGKMCKWHPNPNERVIMVTYHPIIKHQAQAFMAITHLDYRQQEPVVHESKGQACYVGNDYLRREAMMRLLGNERVHVYGRFKDGFDQQLMATGARLYGQFVPSGANTVEERYRTHGFGVNIARSDYYTLNLLTPRVSEVVRAGCTLFCDNRLQIAKPLLGDWFCVNDSQELIAKMDMCRQHPQFWLDSHHYQRLMVEQYLAKERYSGTLWHAAQRLCQGPLNGPWRLSLYDDLLRAAGMIPWMS